MKIMWAYIIMTLCVSYDGVAENVNDSISIYISQNELIVDDETYTQDIVLITNNSHNNVWVVFTMDQNSSNEYIFKKKFLKCAKGGDMRFINWILDGNVNWDNYVDDIYGHFFKILAPSQEFYIIYQYEEDKDVEDMVNSFRILCGRDFGRWKNIVEDLSPSTPPAYQPCVISIPVRRRVNKKAK